MSMRKYKLLTTFIFIVAAVVVLLFTGQSSTKSGNHPIPKASAPGTSKIKSLPFDITRYATTAPSSIWVVVNKQHALNPKDYAPDDLVIPNVPLRVPGNESMRLRARTATAVEQMYAAAKISELDLMLSSGYRSYDYQVKLYGSYVTSMGQDKADTQSARPGYSEHQTGLALDIEPSSRKCELEQCFADTPEGQWLAANSYKYGFILRYTPTDVMTTGYQSEPWHFRYVGNELATEMHKTNVATLEQFFGISGGQDY